MYKYTLAERLGLLVGSYCNSNGETKENFEDKIIALCDEHLPHGSGLDGQVELCLSRSSETKLVIYAEYHHMDESGFYDGWTSHTVTVTPTFGGVNVKVVGPNKNDIKEYLGDLFHDAMNQVVETKPLLIHS